MSDDIATLEKLRRLKELQDAENTPSFMEELGTQAKKVGASLAAGGGETVGGMLQLPKLLSDYLTKNKPTDGGFVDRAFTKPVGGAPGDAAGGFGKTVSDYWQNLDKTQGMEDGFPKTFVKGVGGSLVLPAFGAGPATKPVQTVASNLLSGGIGAVGADTAARFAPEGLKTPAAILGGLVAGGGTGYITGPKQSVAQADLRRVMGPMTPRDWNQTAANAGLLQSQGVKTATAADAFPTGSGVKAIARDVINREGGDALAARVGPRFDAGGDMSVLGEKFLDSLGPKIEPAHVANQLSDAGDAAVTNLHRLATEGVTNSLAGKSIRPVVVESIYNDLQSKIAWAKQNQPQLVPVYQEIAGSLLKQKKGPKEVLTNLQGISFQLKGLKDKPVSLEAGAGKRGSDAMWKKAIGEVEDSLAQQSPDWKQAMDDYASFMQGPVADMKSGAVGRMRSANPANDSPESLAKLTAFTNGYDPTTVQRNTTLLSNPHMTQGPTVDGNSIARALAQQKLTNGSTNPGQTIRGLAGSEAEKRLGALAPGMDTHPLQAADMLQEIKPKGFDGKVGPEMRWWQTLIRPFRTLDMMITLKSERGIAQEIANLLKDPGNIPQLQKIAMFNPDVRKALTLQSAMRPGLVVDNTQEQR